MRVLSILLFAAALLVPAAAAAEPLPLGTPAPSPALVCPVAIASLERVASDATGREYAVVLVSPAGPGLVSGTLWINAGGDAFHVSFIDRIAAPYSLEGRVDPIGIRLPRALAIDHAFVDSLAGTDGGPCSASVSWTPNVKHLQPETYQAKLRTNVPTAFADAVVIADPERVCASPPIPPRTVHVVAPRNDLRVIPGGDSGTVDVLVRLARDSSIASAHVTRTTNPALNMSAITTARQADYQTEIRSCRPVASDYTFVVDYSVR